MHVSLHVPWLLFPTAHQMNGPLLQTVLLC
jgi:hypothetical protein